MDKLIKKLSPTTEFLIVLILGFGLFIYSSTRSFFIVISDYSHSWLHKITSQSYYSIVIYEIIILLIIIYFLRIRSWSIEDFNLKFTFRLIWIALLLMFIRNIIGNISFKIFELFDIIDNKTAKHVQLGFESSWISMTLMIVINSIYEEFLLIGYLFKRLEKYHPILIIGLSTIIRALYHTYQGWMILFMLIPMGLVFGYYYYKYKRLWPLIIAHGFSNLITFLSMQFHWDRFLNN